MKFNADKELMNYLEELENINELNLSISDLLFSLLGNKEIINKKEIDVLLSKTNYSSKELLLGKVIDYLDIDLSIEDNQEIFDNYIAGAISELDPKEYTSNPYYQNIKIEDIKDGDFELIYDHYQAYEIFPCLDMDKETNYIEVNSMGYFKDEFPFIALNHKGVTWMSITPNEIETMKKAINTVKGEVLVFGLGLGYFTYMALLKSDVKKVMVIEKDKKIINLFKKHLLPQFPHNEKLEIVNDDALNYLDKQLNADYAFIDLWHDPTDGIELFIKFKKSEAKQNRCKFLYWLESSFYLYLRRCFITLLLEAKSGYGDNHYKNIETVDDKIISDYYKATKNLVISTRSQLENLLLDESLLGLLLNN